MAEIGIGLTKEFPKPLTDDVVRASDVVITMGCGDACPVYPGKRYLDWHMPDPHNQPIGVVRMIRDQIDVEVHTLSPTSSPPSDSKKGIPIVRQAHRALLRWRSSDTFGETELVIDSTSGSSAAPAGYRFPREVIAVAVRWYLRYGLSYRDVEELLAELGIEVDHVTIYRWVQTFTAEFIDAARASRHAVGDRWFVDETYVKVAGRWIYLYRAVDQNGQVIDVLLSERRNASAARAFFTRALTFGGPPVEVTTDRALVYPRVLDELVPAARHVLEQHANNVIEADHGRLKARLRPMRGLKRIRSARTIRGWPRLRAEPAPRPLRARRRRAEGKPCPRRVQRTRPLPLSRHTAPTCRSQLLRPINATEPIARSGEGSTRSLLGLPAIQNGSRAGERSLRDARIWLELSRRPIRSSTWRQSGRLHQAPASESEQGLAERQMQAEAARISGQETWCGRLRISDGLPVHQRARQKGLTCWGRHPGRGATALAAVGQAAVVQGAVFDGVAVWVLWGVGPGSESRRIRFQTLMV